MRTRIGVSRGTAAIAIAVMVTSCGSGGSGGTTTNSNGLTVAKIGVLPIVEAAPVYLGIQKGFYRDEKIDLKPQLAQGGAAIVPAVVSGQEAFGFSNVVSLLVGQAKGLQLQMVSASSETTGQVGKDFSAVMVKKDSPIKTAKDLEGKTISVNTLQNIGDVTVRAAMAKHGADASGVKFTEIGFPDMPAALQQGRVDAVWVVEPFVSAVLAAGGRAVLWNYADTDPDLIIGGYFVGTKLAKSNPDLVRRFVRATQKSMQYAQSHPDETRAILTTYTQITAEQAKAIVMPRYDPTMDKTVLSGLADLVKKYGLAGTRPDVDALISSG